MSMSGAPSLPTIGRTNSRVSLLELHSADKLSPTVARARPAQPTQYFEQPTPDDAGCAVDVSRKLDGAAAIAIMVCCPAMNWPFNTTKYVQLR